MLTKIQTIFHIFPLKWTFKHYRQNVTLFNILTQKGNLSTFCKKMNPFYILMTKWTPKYDKNWTVKIESWLVYDKLKNLLFFTKSKSLTF